MAKHDIDGGGAAMAKHDRAARCREWAPYVRAMADLMWLRDWTMVVEPEPPDDKYVAQVHCVEGRRFAQVYLSDDFLEEYDERQQRQTVVHELLHCHMKPAQTIAERSMGRRWEDFRLLLEYGVDAIADAFAERLPLPSHVKPKPAKKGTH